VADRAEALLMAADRVQHIHEVIEPSLASGRWVVTDRFSGSTLAYQGYGRGLDLSDLRRMVDWATGGLTPDLSVLVDMPVDDAAQRRAMGSLASDAQGGTEGATGKRATFRNGDRLEQLDEFFHRRVRDGFLALSAADPDRWAVVDGLGSPGEVAARVLAVVTERLGPLPVLPSRPSSQSSSSQPRPDEER
jgi:dTMP kinase